MKAVIFKLLLVTAWALLAASTLHAADPLPRRGFLGARIQPVTDSVRAARDVPFPGGVLLADVLPGGSAADGDLQPGDILLKVADSTVTSLPGFFAVFNRYKGGMTVPLEILRGKERFSLRLALKPFPKETPDDFNVLYESVSVRDSLRRLIITRPRGDGKVPVVFLVGGIGCYSLNQPLGAGGNDAYRTILYAFTRQGFATVRVEKTGMGDSQGPPCATADFHTELDGYRAALAALPHYPFLDTANVIIFGHSMGGVAAPVLYRDFSFKAAIVMATLGKDWIEYELANNRRQSLLAGMDYDSIQVEARRKELALHRLLVERQTPEQILAEHPELAEHLQYPAHYTYMQQVAGVNLAREWKEVAAPVLVVYGAADFVTSADEHQYLTDMINHYHPGHATYVEVPEMDHYFTKVASQRASFENVAAGSPNREFNTAVLPVLIDWCKTVVAGS